MISKTKISVKKDFTDKEKHIEFNMNIEELKLKPVNLSLILIF
jgi:hypothetical protein